jgi:hypothetical protein
VQTSRSAGSKATEPGQGCVYGGRKKNGIWSQALDPANEAPCNIRQLFERSPASVSVSSSFAPHPTNHSHQIIRLFFTLQGQSTLALPFLLLSFQDEVDALYSAALQANPPCPHSSCVSHNTSICRLSICWYSRYCFI